MNYLHTTLNKYFKGFETNNVLLICITKGQHNGKVLAPSRRFKYKPSSHLYSYSASYSVFLKLLYLSFFKTPSFKNGDYISVTSEDCTELPDIALLLPTVSFLKSVLKSYSHVLHTKCELLCFSIFLRRQVNI